MQVVFFDACLDVLWPVRADGYDLVALVENIALYRVQLFQLKVAIRTPPPTIKYENCGLLFEKRI